jgi:hypothetical protein
VRLWVPEGVVALLENRNHSGLEVLFAHILNDIVTVGKCLSIPPITVTRLSVDNLD